MLKRRDWTMIRQEIPKGKFLKDVAIELGVHPRTIRRALDRGGPPHDRPGCPRTSKLDPYRNRVDALLSEGVWNARVILREIEALGYSGGYSILSDDLRPKRGLRPGRATVRFETEPGEQLQNDWGELWVSVGGVRTKVYVSVNTLGYSRRFHVWAALRMDAEHTYEGLIRAFEHLGGGTKEVLVDNQKSLVIAHRAGNTVVFHPGFLDLSGHYGFVPKACWPYRARTKGKDERMVRYVKENFFQRYRMFESLDHLNGLLKVWLRDVADQRLHGTVRKIVADRFSREAPALFPLPAVRFDTSYRERRQVSWDGYVEIRGNRYSVPAALCGQTVSVRIALDDTVRVYDREGGLAATHRLRSFRDGGWVTVPEHHAALWKDAFQVMTRDLSVYEEVATCGSNPSSKN